MKTLLCLPLLAALTMTACARTEFDRGENAKAGAKPQVDANAPRQTPSNDKKDAPTKTDNIDTSRDEPSLDDMFKNTDGGFGDKAKKWLDTTWGSLVNTLKKLPNEIDLGDKTKVYHIGDNNFEGTSDKLKVGREEIKGKIFRFAFEVLEKDITAHLIINKIWGVDQPTNRVSLLQNGTKLKDKHLERGARKLIFDNVALKPGQYVLEIESEEYTMADGNTDRDDIVVEEVKVQTDGKVKSLGVTFE